MMRSTSFDIFFVGVRLEGQPEEDLILIKDMSCGHSRRVIDKSLGSSLQCFISDNKTD